MERVSLEVVRFVCIFVLMSPTSLKSGNLMNRRHNFPDNRQLRETVNAGHCPVP